MKIGYFGTPEHSAKLLSKLISNNFDISFVVTNIDKPQGRERKLSMSAVKKIALENNLPVLQFENLKNEESISKIISYQADIYIVFAYGHIIPEKVFLHPTAKTINLHGSILPEFRGASPVQSAILSNKKETGITLQYITKELDAGDIISIVKIDIEESDTFGTLLEKLTNAGIDEIIKLLKNFNGIPFPAYPQDHSLATFCKKIKTEDRVLDFSQTMENLHNKIRAFNPGNICFTSFRDRRLNVYKTEKTDLNTEENPGTIVLPDKKTLGVVSGDRKILVLKEIQFENKKVMQSIDFINGMRPIQGEKLI